MKIGLIAMSGVRACDKELLEIGLTLPGFVERSKVIASLPSLSLLTLAALTPKDIELDYLEIPDFNDPDAETLPDNYDLVAISTYSAQIFEAYRVADHYRERNIPVVMGGTHVTALPDEAAQHASTVVIGEGEISWPDLIRDFRANDLHDRYEPSPGQSYDLSQAPVPRYDLLDVDRYNRLTVQNLPWLPSPVRILRLLTDTIRNIQHQTGREHH